MVTQILWCVVAWLVLAGVAIPLARYRIAARFLYGGAFIAAATAFAVAGFSLVTGSDASSAHLPLGLPWLGAHFRMDALAAFFLAVVNLGGAAASFFAIGYGSHEIAPGRVLPFYPLFLAGMNLVVLAADAFTFLVSWEFMSLASWALVIAHHRDPENARAGFLYLIMASFGTLALLLAFGLLAGAAGDFSFAGMRAGHLSPALAASVLALTLIGAGSKAGLVPLHVWLPLAHPAAPSHVSALMSGVMTKVAVYAFIRIVFDLLGPPNWWWSMVVLALGAITAVVGVLQALLQHDLKRLLAYHTVENIGIIFIGLGLALAFQANGLAAAAALAFTAALFHVFNHSLFKSLLFFGSGAVLNATGERDMERLGGLIHRMPYTAFAFLVGSAAISALPPLNGFASEWMTFQAIFLSPSLPQWGLKLLVPTVGAMLALSAALAAACFVKAFGVSFLGRARSDVAQAARETDRFSLVAMFFLMSLCVVAGVVPGLAIDALAPAVHGILGDAMAPQAVRPLLSIAPVATSQNSYSGLMIFLMIVATTTVVAFLVHRLARRGVRRGPAWDCGFPNTNPITQYTAGSFAQPIRRVFGVVYRAHEVVTMPLPGDTRPAVFKVMVRDLVWDFIYVPIAAGVGMGVNQLNRLQFLTIRGYLTLVFVTLVVLLLVLAIWQ